MPRYTTSQTFTDGNTQIVLLPEAEEKRDEGPAVAPEDEDYALKLRRISDHVPLRVNNTSGSSAGSGSGDFHQYRSMRRHEQDRLMRMDEEYKKRKEAEEFEARRKARIEEAEKKTAKKRAKRQKQKEMKKQKGKTKPGNGQLAPVLEATEGKDSSDEDEDPATHQEELD